jgi:hypothetical protein
MTQIRQPGHNDDQKKISNSKKGGGHSVLQTGSEGALRSEMQLSPLDGGKFCHLQVLSRFEMALSTIEEICFVKAPTP